jgi:hypothetical protein
VRWGGTWELFASLERGRERVKSHSRGINFGIQEMEIKKAITMEDFEFVIYILNFKICYCWGKFTPSYIQNTTHITAIYIRITVESPNARHWPHTIHMLESLQMRSCYWGTETTVRLQGAFTSSIGVQPIQNTGHRTSR